MSWSMVLVVVMNGIVQYQGSLLGFAPLRVRLG